MKKLLIDMDGVISDYYNTFVKLWRIKYPNRPVVHDSQLVDFYIEKAYPPEHEDDIRRITTSHGFFRGMIPIEGAATALNEILEEGEFDPFICTTPDTHVAEQLCWAEKAHWVENHLGAAWLKRIVMSSDKTYVRGDYLIDDKPDITGKFHPEWKQVVFDQAYNKKTPGPRLNGWSDWKRLKEELL